MANEATNMDALQQLRTLDRATPTPAKPSTTMAHEDKIVVDPSIPTPNQILYLVTLPVEIQTEIYGLAVKHSDVIKPELWMPGESIFAHDSVHTEMGRGLYLRSPVRVNGRMPEALTVVDLLKTCRMIRTIVNKNHLFYHLNRFEFRIPLCMLNYLKALSTGRRQAIKDVTFLFDHSRNSCLAPALTVLRTCLGLRHLTIDITLLSHLFEIPWATTIDQTIVYNKLIALRGLESLTITYGEVGSHWNLVLTILQRVRFFPVTEVNKNSIRFEIHQLQAKINALVTLKRPSPTDTLVTAGELTEAMSHSGVVEGDISSQLLLPRPAITFSTLGLTQYDESGNTTPTPYPVSDEVAAWANDVTPAHWALPTMEQEVQNSSWE
ncbi:hypothetical protein BDZ45DRAFT_94547 [Acephala macrosclerotiorum]|nr:hypothetical protein BDZ45DRAFT_94547 [Acephala macrosclerotiorum]